MLSRFGTQGARSAVRKDPQAEVGCRVTHAAHATAPPTRGGVAGPSERPRVHAAWQSAPSRRLERRELLRHHRRLLVDAEVAETRRRVGNGFSRREPLLPPPVEVPVVVMAPLPGRHGRFRFRLHRARARRRPAWRGGGGGRSLPGIRSAQDNVHLQHLRAPPSASSGRGRDTLNVRGRPSLRLPRSGVNTSRRATPRGGTAVGDAERDGQAARRS